MVHRSSSFLSSRRRDRFIAMDKRPTVGIREETSSAPWIDVTMDDSVPSAATDLGMETPGALHENHANHAFTTSSKRSVFKRSVASRWPSRCLCRYLHLQE